MVCTWVYLNDIVLSRSSFGKKKTCFRQLIHLEECVRRLFSDESLLPFAIACAQSEALQGDSEGHFAAGVSGPIFQSHVDVVHCDLQIPHYRHHLHHVVNIQFRVEQKKTLILFLL